MNLPIYAFFSTMPLWAVVLSLVVVALILSFYGAPLALWTLVIAATLYGFAAPTWLWITFGVIAAVFNVPPIRRILSGGVMRLIEVLKFMPKISSTEQEAIDAGTVWLEGELFSGKPDFRRILEADYPDLSADERDFIDGPCQEVCDLVDDWDVFQRKDLSTETWALLAKHRFFGLIIPKEYGGLGFSPSANSAVVGKVSSANAVLGITVMVPNSLGPAELLIHYGTQAQKDHYLPRLARHEEIPAFALTEPGAGSDAGAMKATGVVFRGDDDRLMLRLNWNKRYITLAPISTVLGLAFKMHDPENLLGKGEYPGITCALVQSDTEGVDNSYRHDPLSIPFYNGPTYGKDVVVPLEDAVIGGLDGVGRGWRMLMESLAAGRGISLPATSTFGTKHTARIAGAHAFVRKQFGLSIGKFEGIEEPLARIAGFAYLLEAARRFTNGALDTGAKPAVVTAMMKYNATELFRMAINDGMDVCGGNAISRGPRNSLAHAYTNMPIAITVEGANILTRTLMIFGQGAIRSHPFILKEIAALADSDVKAFDQAFWSHVGHVGRNKARSFLLSITRGRLAGSPVSGPTAKYYRRIAWASATFAFWADIALGTLGGDLKRKEKVTGRFADIFSWMYLGSAVLRRFEAEGRRTEDLIFVHWSMQYALYRMQVAFDGLFENLRVPGMTWAIRGPIAAWSRMNRLSGYPSDALGHKVAQALQVPGARRDRLVGGSHLPVDPTRPVSRLENAFLLCAEADLVSAKIRAAVKRGEIPKARGRRLIEAALNKQLISRTEAELLERAEVAREDAIQVDSFKLDEYMRNAILDQEHVGGGDGTDLPVAPVH